MSYQWDVFVSYPRREPVGSWVREHFEPLLTKWLNLALTNPPALYVDKKMEEGTHWPSYLQDALARSRCMVAVWAPPYFGSRWCIAEWQTMRARQQQLGLGQGSVPGLIYPVRFFDGDSFPADARETQQSDFTRFNTMLSGKSAQRTKLYRELDLRTKETAETLERWIRGAPPWSADWPRMAGAPAAPAPPIAFNQVVLR